MDDLFTALILVTIVAFIVGLIKPSLFSRFMKGEATRKKVSLILGILMFVFFVGFGLSYEDVSETQNTSSVNQPTISTNQAPITTPSEVSYRVVEEEDISYLGCKRVGIRIVVPDESNKNDVTFTLGKIIDDKKNEWDDITVWAYKNSEEEQIGILPFTMGMKEYSNCN